MPCEGPGVRLIQRPIWSGKFELHAHTPSAAPWRRSSKTGKTTALKGEQARELLDSIDTSTVVGLRDRALISVMTFAFTRIGVVVAMRAEDYYPNGKRWWVRLHEKGGKRHEMRAHHNLEAYLTPTSRLPALARMARAPCSARPPAEPIC